MRKREFLRTAAWTAGASVASRVGWMSITLVSSAFLSPEAVGQIGVFLVAGPAIQSFISLGLLTVIARQIGHIDNETELLAAGWISVRVCAAIGVLALAAILLGPFIFSAIPVSSVEKRYWPQVVTFAWSNIVFAASQSILLAAGRFIQLSLGSVLQGLLYALVTYFSSTMGSVDVLLWLIPLATFVPALIGGAAWLPGAFGPQAQRGYSAIEIARDAVPLYSASLLVDPPLWICRLVLVHWYGEGFELAALAMATALAAPVLWLPSMLSRIAIPLLSRARAQGARSQRQLLLWQISLNVSFGVVTAGALYALSQGKHWASTTSSELVLLIAIANLLIGLNMVLVQQLIVMRWLWLPVLFNGIWALAVVATSAALIPTSGAVGFGYSLIAAYVIHTTFQALAVGRSLRA